MPNDSIEVNQDQTDSEPDSIENTGGDDAETIDGVDSEEENTDQTTLETEVPPELEETRKSLLKDYHAKTQAIASERREIEKTLGTAQSDQATLHTLLQKPWFQKALANERVNKVGGESEITEDELSVIQSDPKAFMEAVRREARRESMRLHHEKVEPSLSKVTASQNEIQLEREYDRAVADYGDDFKKAADGGHLDKSLDEGKTYKEAFAMHSLDGPRDQSSVEKQAARLLASRKAASVAKGGRARVTGSEVVKVKSFDEALDFAMDSLKRDKDVKLEKA